jgi:hypothetical protein
MRAVLAHNGFTFDLGTSTGTLNVHHLAEFERDLIRGSQ